MHDYRVKINGRTVFSYDGDDGFGKFIRAVYRHFNIGYSRFFKMDPLSKLGFMSAELLLDNPDKNIAGKRTGCILTNASSSLEIDEKHQESINDREHYFPSPANFVYTLPNIMAGEAAIRHKILGENTVMISDGFDERLIFDITRNAFETGTLDHCICGWVEQYGNNHESLLFLVERMDRHGGGESEDVIFEPSILLQIYKQEI